MEVVEAVDARLLDRWCLGGDSTTSALCADAATASGCVMGSILGEEVTDFGGDAMVDFGRVG